MTTIELEYTERLCYYVHGVRIENTPLPCLPAQANRAGRKTNAAPTFSYESSVSPISMTYAYNYLLRILAEYHLSLSKYAAYILLNCFYYAIDIQIGF